MIDRVVPLIFTLVPAILTLKVESRGLKPKLIVKIISSTPSGEQFSDKWK